MRGRGRGRVRERGVGVGVRVEDGLTNVHDTRGAMTEFVLTAVRLGGKFEGWVEEEAVDSRCTERFRHSERWSNNPALVNRGCLDGEAAVAAEAAKAADVKGEETDLAVEGAGPLDCSSKNALTAPVTSNWQRDMKAMAVPTSVSVSVMN